MQQRREEKEQRKEEGGAAGVDLGHDLQRPAVPDADWLAAALGLGGSQQRRTENGGQIVQRHLVDVFLLCHPENAKKGEQEGRSANLCVTS